MNLLKKIKQCFDNNQILYTHHAVLEMRDEEFGRIFEQEVYESIRNGEIIEKYSDDKPYPSVLLFGKTSSGRPLHVVCAYDKEENLAIIVTVYQPDPDVWVDNKKRRKQ